MQSVDFRVVPVPGGWLVVGPPDLAPLVVRSGGRAEAKAEALARAMTAAGVDTRVVVLDRAGQAIGTKRFWSQEAQRPGLVASLPGGRRAA